MDFIIKTYSFWGLTKKAILHSSIYIFIFFIVIFNTFEIGCIEAEPLQNASDTFPEGQNNSGTIIDENIENTLVGRQIVYYDIAGEPRYYNISKKDIRSVEKSESNGEVVWVVTVGSGMQWKIYLNSTGESILKETQLFRT